MAEAWAYQARDSTLFGDCLRRSSISRTYYALFHALARSCADSLIGEEGTDRTDRAWRQTYRSLDHVETAKACERCVRDNRMLGFPPSLLTFARFLPVAMRRRHQADYDPDYAPTNEAVAAMTSAANRAITALTETDLRDRRAFAAFILFERGRRNIAPVHDRFPLGGVVPDALPAFLR